MTRDLVLGCILLALSIAYYGVAAAIPDSDLADAVGPAGLPSAYAVLLGALSLLLIVRAMRARRVLHRATSDGQTSAEPRSIGRVAALLAIGIVYIVVVPFAGYLISIAALIVVTAIYHTRFAPAAVAGGHPHSTTRVLLVGAAGAGLLWLVFVVLLRIPQPAGIWPMPGSGT